jgi:hypothetical protein
LKRIGFSLINGLNFIWKAIFVPILSNIWQAFLFSWRNPAISWIASIGIIIGLFKMNQSGLDEKLFRLVVVRIQSLNFHSLIDWNQIQGKSMPSLFMMKEMVWNVGKGVTFECKVFIDNEKLN